MTDIDTVEMKERERRREREREKRKHVAISWYHEHVTNGTRHDGGCDVTLFVLETSDTDRECEYDPSVTN